MKKILILSMLFFSLNVNAQIDTSQIKFIEPPDSTAIGTPDGKLISKEIGTAGGTIVSEDGRVELIFPEDALTAKTTISIQPTTNPVSQGVGKAYQFEPSGTQFKKPVQLIFHYTNEEVETCPADLMDFALQDHKGKWTFFKYENRDSTTKTLKGSIHHFSGMTTANRVMLKPERWEVMADDRVNILVYNQFETAKAKEKIIYKGNFEPVILRDFFWVVNGVKGGNDVEGEIGFQPTDNSNAVAGFPAYRAPKILPPKDPVAIQLFCEYYSDILQKYIWGVASCNVIVCDEYKIEISSIYTGRAEMHSQLSDKGSFVVTIAPFPKSSKFVISEIQNYPPSVIKEGKNGPFKEKVFTGSADGPFANSVRGHINLTSETNDKLSNDYPPKVSIEFKSEESILCLVQHTARGITSPISPLYYKPIPEEISFIANGEPQHYDVFLVYRDIGYEMNVTPHREESKK